MDWLNSRNRWRGLGRHRQVIADESNLVQSGACVFCADQHHDWHHLSKKYCPSFDLRAGSVIQFGASAIACLPFVFLIETRDIDWQPALIGALLWAIFALSIGAISLLFVLIREGAATQVTSLLYLTPPTTALMAWSLFGEPITLTTIAGTLLTVWGVWWVMSAKPSDSS